MKKTGIILFLLWPLFSLAGLPVRFTTEFVVATPQDTIRCIRIAQDTTHPRPVLLFLQGSLPYPLIVTDNGKASVFYLDQCDFDYEAISARYDIVLIAKPYTPVAAETSELNEQWQYVPDTAAPQKFDPRYLDADRPEEYVRRTDAVLDYIRRQEWANNKQIILMGHSQGAHIAALVAEHNPDLYAVGYFSGNPAGRFAELIAVQENAAKAGRITREEAQRNLQRLYDQWRHICRDGKDSGDRAATWMGFSRPYVQRLAALSMPLYIAYGTEDPGGQHSVLLPIYFELAGKHNYHIRAFEGRGHNFETVGKDGKSNYDDIQWKQAIGEFLAWLENLDK